MYRILIVEDDPTISSQLKKHIASWGCVAENIKNFNDIMPEFSAFGPSIVLMDISLPCNNGYYWCREIRKISKVPIIFISSASDNMNIIMAVHMGADDFIAKPFDINVLIAKIQATLRRTYEFEAPSNIMALNDAILNTNEMTITCKDEKQVLTKNEFRILQVLMENKKMVVARDKIMERLWESDSYIDDNTLTVNINRLRKKLAAIGLESMITTVKGVGYKVE